MANAVPHRKTDGKAPAAEGFSPTADGRGSDKDRHPSPCPVADTPGRPYIHPHRIAQATRDRDAAYNRLRAGQRDYRTPNEEIERLIRGERLADRLYTWVIVIAVTLMGLALLATAIDAYLDSNFAAHAVGWLGQL